MASLTTPPGQYPPFAVVTPTDHTAWIVIAAALGTSLSLLFAGIRVFIRSSGGSSYGPDDMITATATALSVAQSSLVLVACHRGLGKSATLLAAEDLISAQKFYYASNLVYVVCLVTSKTVPSCFIMRLTPIKSHTVFLKCILAALILWGIIFIFAEAFQCDDSHPWLLVDQQCDGYFAQLAVFESIGCLYEAAVVAMSLWLIWSLKTTLSNKVTVIVTFGARLVLVAIVALRLKSFNRSGQTSDPTLLEAEFIVWTSTELNYSVISATFPIMRPFVNNLTTNYGGRGSGGSDCISQKRGDNVTADIHGRHNETLRRWSSPQDVDARESTTSVKESVSDKTQG